MIEQLVKMECFLSTNGCKYSTSQDQCQSSFSSSWELLWETAWLLTPLVTFTNSRLVAVHRRKQALTKMNDGGCRGGKRVARWDLYPSASSISRSAVLLPSLQAPHPPTIYLTAWGSWWLRPDFWWICLCQSMAAQPLQVGSCNKHVHLPDFPPPLKQNEKKAVKLTKKKKKAPTTISEAWKVISDRTCQEVYGRFTQSYEKERREPGD